MRTQRSVSLLGACAMLLVVAPDASATDGHFLHGVGAINSAMGGVGVASPSSLLGAFYVNPAGIVQYPGTAMELGFEMFKADRTIASVAGPGSGSTRSSSEFVPVPTFGWSRALSQNVAVGVAGLGIGGFGVDYRTDATNPIVAPRPYGFGAIYSNFSLMKIIPAVAWRAGERLRIGAALNIDWASLAVDPMPVAAPAVDPGPDGTPNTQDDRAYYSRATDADGSFGIGGQLGVQYQLTPMLALGLAYTTTQRFQEFEYDAVYENPNLPSYNTPRSIRFAMDVPAVFAGGVSFAPMEAWRLDVDGRYIDYANTRGFAKSGFGPDGAVLGFGWESIWVLAVGTQLRPMEPLSLRAGYNYSQNPVPSALMMFNAAAPAIVQHHLTVGAGWMFENGFGVDVGYYRVFENTVTGPFQTMGGPAPSTSVSSTMSEQSILLGFTFSPPVPR